MAPGPRYAEGGYRPRGPAVTRSAAAPRTPLGDGVSLTLASVVNGIAAYAFAVIGTRYLGADGFSDVSVAWSFWALTVAVITLPVQHWLTWRSEIDGGLAGILGARRRLLLVGALASTLAGLVALQPRLFSAPARWALVVVGLGIASWVLGWGRGMLAARGDYRRLAFVIGGENVIRVAALGFVMALGGSALLVGCALLTGPLALIFVWRALLPEPNITPVIVPVMRSVLALSGAMAMAQSLLQLGPAAAAWLNQPDTTVTATFSTFALFRAPVLVLLALSSRVTAPMTRLVADRAYARLQRLVNGLTTLTVVAATATGGIAYLAGPTIVEAMFGRGTSLPRWETGLVASGMVLAAYALLQLLLFLSSERAGDAVWIWAAATLIGFGFLISVNQGPVSVAFFASELSAVTAGVIAHWLWLRPDIKAGIR